MFGNTLYILVAAAVVVGSVALMHRIKATGKRLSGAPAADMATRSLAMVQGAADPVAIKSSIAEYLLESAGVGICAFLSLRKRELRWSGGTDLPRGFQERLRFEPQSDLLDRLRQSESPAPLASIRAWLPPDVLAAAEELDLSLYLPVVWGDDIYGLCLLRGTPGLLDPTVSSTLAAMVRTLAAARRMRRLEEKSLSLQHAIDQMHGSGTVEPRPVRPPSILKLVRHRNSETIIPRIIESIRDDLALDRVAYFYDDRDGLGTPRAYWDHPDHVSAELDRKQYQSLARALDGLRAVAMSSLETDDESLQDWLRNLGMGGLTHLALFPISGRRGGVLAWSGGGDFETVAESLAILREHADDLVSNALTYEKVKEMSFRDNLTGLANQRYFRKRLSEEVARAKRYRRSMSLVLFDLDGLKHTNDTYGHLAGDQLLTQLGRKLQSSVRSIDVIARYGGDEFCIIMPESDAAQCALFMQRFQKEIASTVFFVDDRSEPLTCTVSIGGAVCPDHGEDTRSLIHAADTALLRAKDAGRNTALLFG